MSKLGRNEDQQEQICTVKQLLLKTTYDPHFRIFWGLFVLLFYLD